MHIIDLKCVSSNMEYHFLLWFLMSVFVATGDSGSENETIKELKSIIEKQTKMTENLNNVVLQLQVSDRHCKNEIEKLQVRGQQSESDIAMLKAEIIELKREKSDDQYTRMVDKRLLVGNIDADNVAFYAYMNSHEKVQQHHTLIFDVLKLNIGHAYNNNTGVFTAPRTGLYILTFTVHSYYQSYSSVQLVVNNVVEATIFTDGSAGDEYNAATSVAPAWLNQGDTVYVRTHPTYGSVGKIRSDDLMRSSFAGWKV